MKNSLQNIVNRITHLLLTKEGLYILYLCFIWCHGLFFFTRTFVVHNQQTAFLGPYINSIILFLLCPIAIDHICRHIRVQDIVFLILCLIIYAVQFLIYPQNSEILIEYIPLSLIGALPLYLIGVQIDIEKLEIPFRNAALVVIAFCLFYSFIYSRRVHGELEQDADVMDMAYLLSPQVIYLAWQTLKNFSWLNLISSLIGFFVLLSYGTRGPIVCVLFFIVLYLLFVNPSKHKTLWILFATMIVGIIIIFSDTIFLYLYDLMAQINMSNRIFQKLLLKEFAGYQNSSERDVLLSKLWDVMLHSDDLFGYGILGTWKIINTYAHNFVFDIWVSFGFIPGTILILIVVCTFAHAFFSCKTSDEKAFFLVLFVSGFFKLFMSNTYLKEQWFWLLLGYSIYLIRHKHSKIRNNGTD